MKTGSQSQKIKSFVSYYLKFIPNIYVLISILFSVTNNRKEIECFNYITKKELNNVK